MYWTLSVIRNHLSHGRINELKYKGRSLEERDAKEEILTDYLEAMLFDDKTQSTWWGMLSEKEREDIVKQSNEMIDEMKPTD